MNNNDDKVYFLKHLSKAKLQSSSQNTQTGAKSRNQEI